jgi:hypothetical protein
VEQLRAKNVFKADKGVKCPFCRAYIESYTPANRWVSARWQKSRDHAEGFCRQRG